MTRRTRRQLARIFGLGILLLAARWVWAQATIEFVPARSEIVLQNAKCRQVLRIGAQGGVSTASFRNQQAGTELCRAYSEGFAFRVDGQTVTGGLQAAAFAYQSDLNSRERE